MKLEPLQIRVYFIEWKEPCGIEGTVVIKYNLDLILIHVVFIREFDRSVNPLSCSSFRNFDKDPTNQQCGGKVNHSDSMALIMGVDTDYRFRFYRG